jgi:hypothetical protein
MWQREQVAMTYRSKITSFVLAINIIESRRNNTAGDFVLYGERAVETHYKEHTIRVSAFRKLAVGQ